MALTPISLVVLMTIAFGASSCGRAERQPHAVDPPPPIHGNKEFILNEIELQGCKSAASAGDITACRKLFNYYIYIMNQDAADRSSLANYYGSALAKHGNARDLYNIGIFILSSPLSRNDLTISEEGETYVRRSAEIGNADAIEYIEKHGVSYGKSGHAPTDAAPTPDGR